MTVRVYPFGIQLHRDDCFFFDRIEDQSLNDADKLADLFTHVGVSSNGTKFCRN